jgi:signal transduction histidine kinase
MSKQMIMKKMYTKIGILLLLTGLAFFGNVFKIHLFFNVDFLLGSIAVMLVIYLYGLLPGIFAAVIAASYSYVLWNHPYAIIIFTAEAVFVGLVLRQRRAELVAADALYWILIGMPLVFLFYYGIMGVGLQSCILIMMKQAINGIFNALIASVIINLLRPFLIKQHLFPLPQTVSFRNLLFTIMVTIVLMPSLILMIVSSKEELRRIERQVVSRLEDSAASTAETFRFWLNENIQNLRFLANFISGTEQPNEEEIRREMRILAESDDDFQFLSFYAQSGTQLIVYPRSASINQNLLRSGAGTGSADFGAQSPEPELAVHPLDMENSVLLLSLPVGTKDERAGMVSGAIKLTSISGLFEELLANADLSAYLIDDTGRIIAEGGSGGFEIGDPYLYPSDYMRTEMRQDLALIQPSPGENVSIMERWQKSVYEKSLTLDFGDWRLVLTASTAPFQDYLNERYFVIMLIMLVVVIGVIGVAALLSHLMVVSIGRLGNLTSKIGGSAPNEEELKWPRSRIFEVQALITNFKTSFSLLRKNMAELAGANKELKKAKEEADTANRAKSQFLANISHDLKTPLNGILGFSGMLKNDPELEEEQRRSIQIIEQSGLHLLDLISDILDISKVEVKKMQLHHSPVDLSEFLRTIYDMMRVQAEGKGLAFKLEIDGDLPLTIYTDEKRLRQVLINLLSNAVKFTESGSIIFRVYQKLGSLCFEVEDTGPGIPEDLQKAVFSPFKQLEGDGRNIEGTGLGLSIVKKLLKLMGSEIELYSEAGKGSTFSFSLPIISRPPAGTEQKKA